MKKTGQLHLSQLLPDKSPKTVFGEVERVYRFHYSDSTFTVVRQCYHMIEKLFKGKYEGYKSCNTNYHDFGHTLDALLAAVRLLDGINLVLEPISEGTACTLLLGTLFHDTGYLQEIGDEEGTGAKFTANHVERSIQFLKQNGNKFHVKEALIPGISNIICCTGLNAELDSIPFTSKEESIAGTILGASDLLGQMSQREYLEKLLFLYYEFREAGISGFDTEFDILRKTLDFYEMVKDKFKMTYHSIHEYGREHFRTRFGIDSNLYMEAIDKNIGYLHRIIEDETTNFRHKLKRGSWIVREKRETAWQVQ